MILSTAKLCNLWVEDPTVVTGDRSHSPSSTPTLLRPGLSPGEGQRMDNLQSSMALGYLLLPPRTLILHLKTSMPLIQFLLPAASKAVLSPIEDENRVVLRQRSGRNGRQKAAPGRSQLVLGRTQDLSLNTATIRAEKCRCHSASHMLRNTVISQNL